MRVVITGGQGMLGRKLATALAARGQIRNQPITAMALADTVPPQALAAPFPVTTHTLDIRERAGIDALLADGAGVIYHLAAIPSAGAEAAFDDGIAVNLQGSINVFEAARALGTRPVLVFSSTLAVYGGDVPAEIEDWTALNPQTTYGAAKAASEMLLTDYSRRGFLDGRGLRLPTITIRPGKPNTAASGFMSSIFREPLQGDTAVCPVSPDYLHWYLSPRRCVQNLIHGAEVEADALGQNRCFCLPGNSWTIGEMVDVFRRVAGEEVADRIRWEPMPEIQEILDGWRGQYNPQKALSLGFVKDESFEDNIRYFLEDDIAR